MFFLFAWCFCLLHDLTCEKLFDEPNKIGVWWKSKNLDTPSPKTFGSNLWSTTLDWNPTIPRRSGYLWRYECNLNVHSLIFQVSPGDGQQSYTRPSIYIYISIYQIYLIKPMWRRNRGSCKEVYINWRAWLVAIFPWDISKLPNIEGLLTPSFPTSHHRPPSPRAQKIRLVGMLESLGIWIHWLPAESLLRVSVGDQHDGQATKMLHPPRSLTVRPWKVTFPERKESFSNRLFLGASC